MSTMKYFMGMMVVLFSLSSCGSAPNNTAVGGGGGAVSVAALSTPVFSNVSQMSPTLAKVQVSSNVTDQYGAALPGVSVTFTATGAVPASNSAVTVVSNAVGIATASLFYDPNSPPTVVASAGAVTSVVSSSAPHPVGQVQLASPVTTGVVADGVGSYTVTAQVLDAYGSPVANEPISFTKTGTGLVVLTPSSPTTSVAGIVTVTVTDISSVNDVVNISAMAGGVRTVAPLALSFVGSGGGGGGGGINTISLNALANNLPADGYTAATVTVSVVDGAGAAVPNLPLTVSSTGSAVLSAMNITTNVQGIASFTVKDTIGETVTITVSDGTSSGVLNQTFIPAVSTLRVVSSTTTVLAGGKATATLTISAKDAQGRGVTGEQLSISTNSATAFIPNTAVTDMVAGQATIQISDIYAENVIVTVQSRAGGILPGVVKSGTASITFVKGTNAITVSIANNGNIVQGTPQQVTATVTDPAGNGVANTVVTFTTDPLIGAIVPASGTALTDAYGRATVSLDAVAAGAATITATATVNGIAVSGNAAYTTSLPGGSAASAIGLAASKYIVLTGGTDSTTLTATVQDAANAAVSGATVTFHTNAGLLAQSQVTTDAYGRASTTLSSGSTSLNVQADVYATVAGAPESVHLPISIQGTNLSLTGTTVSLSNAVPYTADTLTLTVVNGAGVPVPNQHIALTSVVTNSALPISAASTPARLGIHSTGIQDFWLDTYTYQAVTDVNGRVVLTVDAYSNVRGTENNRSTLVACLDPYTGNTGMTSTTCLSPTTTGKLFRAYQVTGAAFGITSPAIDNYTMDIYSTVADIYTITVNNAGANAPVTFSTSLGALLNPYSAAIPPLTLRSPGRYSTVTVTASASGYASVDFYGDAGGLATIQATSMVSGVQQTSLTHIVLSPPVPNASQITMQAAANVLPVHTTQAIAPSTNLTATVRDAYGFPVAQVPVAFSIGVATGGGENVSPSLAYTDSAGVAHAVFTVGTQSSGAQGVDIYATVAATTATPVAPAKANVVIGGTAGSVTVNRGTQAVTLDPATYQMPMSLVVADSNGNPVAGAQVSLSVWPSYYSYGYWSGVGICTPNKLRVLSSVPLLPMVDPYSLPNEDVNRNLILDASEDITWTVDGLSFPVPIVPNPTYSDGVLTPGNSVGGTLPASVITDVNGVATFNLTYLKANSQWVKDKITATTVVSGSQSVGTVEFTLPTLSSDTCFLPNSPFNDPAWGL